LEKNEQKNEQQNNTLYNKIEYQAVILKTVHSEGIRSDKADATILLNPFSKKHDPNLTKQFNFNVFNFSRVSEMCKILEKVKKQQGPIKLLIINGHGTPTEIFLDNSLHYPIRRFNRLSFLLVVN
jgi:hypothetical protein